MKTKDEILQSIINQLAELNEVSSDQSGAILLYGDSLDQKSLMHIKGNVQALAMYVCNMMENNEGIRNFLTASVGAFLSKNPEFEKEFKVHLEMAKNGMSCN